MRRTAVTLLVVVTLVISSTTALAAVDGQATDSSPTARDGTHIQSILQQNSSNNSSVTVGVGRQLSTVVVEADSDVRTDFESSRFDDAFDAANTSSRARLVAERADAIVERATKLRHDYRIATVAYEQGDISRTTYAQYLATLNARAENIDSSIDRLQAKAADVSALDRRAAGYSVTELRRAERALDELTGAGVSELRQRFTGHGSGDVDVDREDGGLTVRVSSQNGDVTREIERERDDDDSIVVDQSTALETARGTLEAHGAGSWSLERSIIDRGDGDFEFAFALTGTNATGTATVAVDGSSGSVYSLEAEVDAPSGEESDDDSDDDSDDSDSDASASDEDATENSGSLTVLATDSLSDIGSEAIIQVMDDGTAVSGATVTVNGQSVGTTDADGTISLTVPDDDTIIRVQSGSASGSLAVDAEEHEDEELYENLDASATRSNSQVTVSVTYNGAGVADATVYANGQAVGTTDTGGALTFDADADADLDVRVQKGEFQASFTFDNTNGAYSLSDTVIGEDASDDGDAEEDDGENLDIDGDSDLDDGDDEDDSDDSDGDFERTDSDDENAGDTESDTDDGDSESESDDDSDTEGEGDSESDSDEVEDGSVDSQSADDSDLESDGDGDGDDESDGS